MDRPITINMTEREAKDWLERDVNLDPESELARLREENVDQKKRIAHLAEENLRLTDELRG